MIDDEMEMMPGRMDGIASCLTNIFVYLVCFALLGGFIVFMIRISH